MKKLLTATLLLTMITPCLWAQKTKANTVRQELSQARSYIKSGKYGDAEKSMTALLKDSANRDNKRIYQLWFEAVHGLYTQGNEKLYLKQQYDTTAFFSNVKRLFSIAETLDSIDARPDSKGRVAPEYRQKHAALLHQHRSNLFNGGTFFIRKFKWQEAYGYFETYIDCARQPLFSSQRYDSLDARMPEAAYWATYAGYKMNDAVLTLRYHKLAMQDSSRLNFTLQFVAEARRWLKDGELYLETLQEGFRRYPQFPYFFPRLYDVYMSNGQYEQALAVTDSALAVNDSSQLYLFAKSTVLLSMNRYADCIKYSERLIEMNDSMPEPYFNAGTAYINIADKFDERKDCKLMRNAYQKARGFMEHYRLLMPEEKQKWGPALYRIYLNLNMGRQFDEIDRLLKEN